MKAHAVGICAPRAAPSASKESAKVFGFARNAVISSPEEPIPLSWLEKIRPDGLDLE